MSHATELIAGPRVLFASGEPRFRDPALAALAARDGDAAAWAVVAACGPESVLDQVHGSFAVVVGDDRGPHWMAVDRFAEHSLCYRVVDGEVKFARRADHLGAGAGDVDPQAIFDYLYFHVIPSPRTIFTGVHRLPAGHMARFDGCRVDVSPYWTPRFVEPSQPPSFGALRDEFRGLLTRAVKDQLDGTQPACFLSGGTDSSTVAGTIGQVAGRPAACYSIGFDASGYDEMAYARLAAKHFGAVHHEYYVTPDDLVAGIPAVAGHYDQPFGNSSALPAYYCALRAREDGVTRLLAGDGGDEFFGGNSRYATQRVFDAYQSVPGWIRHGLVDPVLDSDLVGRLPLLRKGTGYVRQANTPMPDRLQRHNLLLRLGCDRVLSADFRARVSLDLPLKLQQSVWNATPTTTALNRMLAYDWRFTLAESDLPKVCGSTELAGMSVAFPLLDQRLVDFSMRLPTRYKLKGSQLRWFFKEALRGFLPDAIITKSKKGFGLPFGVWVNRHEPLRRLALDSLGQFAGRGIVQPNFVRQLIDVHLPAHPGYYGEMVWIMMVLEQWLRAHAPDYAV